MIRSFALISLFYLLSSGFAQIDYAPYDQMLAKFVVGNEVDYQSLINTRAVLDDFTQQLGLISPDSNPELFPNRNDRLAYWINTYNAFILKKIIDNYPVESIKDINFIGFTVWLSENLIGGTQISFKKLEDDIIRNRFNDPRIHFAINCASYSCPPLRKEAFRPENLDEQLDEGTGDFINAKENFSVDSGNRRIELSSIFDWYEDDFLDWLKNSRKIENPQLLDYIKMYYRDKFDPEWYTYELSFTDYDWSLNDIPR